MNIPKSIKIGMHTYSVNQTNTADLERGKGNWGITDHQNHKILLDKELPDSRKKETLIHELLHVVFFQSGVSDEIRLDPEKRYDEEELVNRFAPQITELFTRNKIV